LDILSRREHSRTELRNKLVLKKYCIEQIESLLDILVREELQSDERFAESYIRFRSKRGFGLRRLLQELETRGVSISIVNQAVLLSGVDFFQVAETACRKKFSRKATTLIEKSKQVRFMEYRGFYMEEINHAIRILNDDENI
jgi:regulatory protein